MNENTGPATTQFPETLTRQLRRTGVVAVLVIDEVEHAVPLAKALLKGGVGIMELTLRTPAAIDSLKAIRDQVPEMVAGVGTILSDEQVVVAKNAGAAFGVAPGMNPHVIQTAQNCGLPFAPGIATASELEHALDLNCRLLKLFPAESLGGLGMVKALAAAYAHTGVQFIPLGGLTEKNAPAYLDHPQVLAIGGSWIAPRALVATEDWESITRNAAAAIQLRQPPG